MTIEQWRDQNDHAIETLFNTPDYVKGFIEASCPYGAGDKKFTKEERDEYVEILSSICFDYGKLRSMSPLQSALTMRTESWFNSLVLQNDKKDGEGLFQNTDKRFIDLRASKLNEIVFETPTKRALIMARFEQDYWKRKVEGSVLLPKRLPYSRSIISNQAAPDKWAKEYALLQRPGSFKGYVTYTVFSRPTTGKGSWTVPPQMWAIPFICTAITDALVWASRANTDDGRTGGLRLAQALIRYLPTVNMDPVLASMVYNQVKVYSEQYAGASGSMYANPSNIANVGLLKSWYESQIPESMSLNEFTNLESKFWCIEGFSTRLIFTAIENWPDPDKGITKSMIPEKRFRHPLDEHREGASMTWLTRQKKYWDWFDRNHKFFSKTKNDSFDYDEVEIRSDDVFRDKLLDAFKLKVDSIHSSVENLSFSLKSIIYDPLVEVSRSSSSMTGPQPLGTGLHLSGLDGQSLTRAISSFVNVVVDEVNPIGALQRVSLKAENVVMKFANGNTYTSTILDLYKKMHSLVGAAYTQTILQLSDEDAKKIETKIAEEPIVDENFSFSNMMICAIRTKYK